MVSNRASVPDDGQVVVKTALGWVVAILNGDRITALDIVTERPSTAPAQGALAKRLAAAVAGYFAGRAWPDDLPLAPAGTPFQQRVWDKLRRIPCGATRRYGDIASELGTSARAVGGACRANPLLLLIPCHRVVASNGRGGFAGHSQGRWPAIKAWLLDHEQSMA